MKRYLFQAAILFMFFLPLSAGTAMAQTSPEQLREQTIADFKKWREDIPDYEKRLYDRVKKINKRTVRLMNVVIGGFVLILIVLVVGFSLILARLKRGTPMRDGSSLQDESESESEKMAQLHEIKIAQQTLRGALNAISMQTRESQSHIEEILVIIDNVKGQLENLDQESADIQESGAKAVIKKQKKLQHAQEDLNIYLRETREYAHGIFRLVDSAERTINFLDKNIRNLEG